MRSGDGTNAGAVRDLRPSFVSPVYEYVALRRRPAVEHRRFSRMIEVSNMSMLFVIIVNAFSI